MLFSLCNQTKELLSFGRTKKKKGKMKIGPVGKHDARSTTIVNWDEGSHDGFISQIFLSHGVAGIMSIQFQFVMDGKLVLSDRHGPFSGNMFDVVSLIFDSSFFSVTISTSN
jgi:hypothetical protein